MQIELPHHIADTPHCRGGFADVLKYGDHGREVAVKVLRIYSDSDLQKIARVSQWWSGRLPSPFARRRTHHDLYRGSAKKS